VDTRAIVLAVSLAACASRRTNRDAGAPTPPDRPRVVHALDVVAPPPERSHDAWWSSELLSAAVSNALAVPGGGDPIAVVADVSEDQARAVMRLVRWSPRGVAEVARKDTTGTLPGGAIALARRASGYVAVWWTGDDDGGVRARAIELDATGFTGDERAATEAEGSAADWARVANLPRRRASAQEMAPPVLDERVTAQVEVRRSRPTPSLVLGALVVTQGHDLTGFEPAIGLAAVGESRRWVAASRGHCAETRVEVFLVDGEAVTTRGRYLFGTETGVRWIRVDATAEEAVVTWYQSLIPLRIDCIRGVGGATLEDHGVRVTRVKAVGPAPRAMPDAGWADAGTD
jgi:hypothetical protein